MSNSLETPELQHTRLLSTSLSLRVCSNSCTLSQWCYQTISPSATAFSFYLQYFSASGSFPLSQLFQSGSQSSGASTSVSVLPMSIQGWFPLWMTGLILQFKRLSRVFSSTIIQKHLFFNSDPSLLFSHPKSHICTWKLKNHSFNYRNLCWENDISVFNMLSSLS